MTSLSDIDYSEPDLGMVITHIERIERQDSEDLIAQYMEEHHENYYNAREKLREKEYGGKPPQGFQSWGDYWKAF